MSSKNLTVVGTPSAGTVPTVQADGSVSWTAATTGATLDTDGTFAANSDTKVASQKATRTLIGAMAAAKYHLISTGSVVTAYDDTGAVVATGADGGAVLTTCLPAVNSAGATIEFRNDGNAFPWTSAALLPSGVTGRLRIIGNGVTIAMSGNGIQFLGINRTADFQSFQHVAIRGFTVDCTSLTNSTGSITGLIGTRTSSTSGQRINYLDWVIEDIAFTNVVVDSGAGTNGIWGLNFVTYHPAVSEGTQTTIKRIRASRVEMDGGNALFIAAGNCGQALDGLNVFIDEIYLENWRHDLGAVPTAFFPASYAQIGARAKVGRCYVGKGYGRGSGDIGIEIDCPIDSVVEHVTADDGWNALLYYGNLQTPTMVGANAWTSKNCVNRKIASISATNQLFKGYVNSVANIAAGDMVFENCANQDHTVNASATTLGMMGQLTDQASAGFKSLTLKNCRFVTDAIAVSSGVTWVGIHLTSRTTPCRVIMDNCRFELAGVVSGGVSCPLRLIEFSNGTFPNFILRDVTVDNQITGNASTVMTNINIAISGSTTVADGKIENHTLTCTDTTITALQCRGTTYLTIPSGKQIMLADSFLKNAKASGEISLVNDTAVQSRVFTRNNIWHTTNGQSAPTTKVGLSTGVGSTLGTTWAALVQFVQGSGTSITAIDISTDGGTNYTNLLTQGSGAMPAGQDITVGPMRGDSLVKVTFTGTQPTINLYPANI